MRNQQILAEAANNPSNINKEFFSDEVDGSGARNHENP